MDAVSRNGIGLTCVGLPGQILLFWELPRSNSYFKNVRK